MNWIDIRVRKPTVDDSDEDGNVLFRGRNSHWVVDWYDFAGAVAWMSIPKFTPLPDPPQGYRLVDTSNETLPEKAKVWIKHTQDWVITVGEGWDPEMIYAVPIDPLAPQYRPFANRVEFFNEFGGFCNRVLKIQGEDTHTKVVAVDQKGVWLGGYPERFSWTKAFKHAELLNGQPFGVLNKP